MGKKKKKKRTLTFSEMLADSLEAGTPGDLASRLDTTNMTGEQFTTYFDQARDLMSKGADPREVVKFPSLFQVAFMILATREEDEDSINDIISMTSAKEVKKEAKRIMHQLRSRGLNVSVTEEKGSSILDRKITGDDPDLPCFLSPITSTGNRMMLVARYVRGGVGVYQAELNDIKGLLEFSGATIGRNRYRKLFKDVMNNDEQSMLEISYSEGRKRLANAVSQSRKSSTPLPDGYLEASSNLPEAETQTNIANGRELYPLKAVSEPDLAQEAKKLHELVEFADWIPDEEVVKTIHNKFKEIEASKVIINEQQKTEQVDQALNNAVEQMLADSEHRTQLQDRLFEMANYLDRIEQKDNARLAAAAAWQLSLEEVQAVDCAFFDRLVKKMFRSPEEIASQLSSDQEKPEVNEDKGPEKLIVP